MVSKNIYTVDEIKTALSNILINTPVKKAILFGSYAAGKATKDSDIDILIDSKGMLTGLNFYGVYEDIASVFLKHVDLIEAYDLDEASALYKDIDQKGVVVYDQEK